MKIYEVRLDVRGLIVANSEEEALDILLDHNYQISNDCILYYDRDIKPTCVEIGKSFPKERLGP